MRKHNHNKSLSLSTQTVRSLAGADLTLAVGGYLTQTCAARCPTLQQNALCTAKA